MDTLSEKITLISVLDEPIEFDSKIENLCELVKNRPDKTAPLQTGLSLQLLNFIKTYLEKHEYDPNAITYTFPTKSAIMKDNIDEISYNLLKDYLTDGNFIDNARRISPLLVVTDVLQFRKLTTLLNVLLIVPLHMDEDEKSIKDFMENNNIREEDFDANGIDKAVKENKDYFELVVNRFVANIKRLDEIQGIKDDVE